MNNRENLVCALEGEIPERIPYTIYADLGMESTGLDKLMDLGFCQTLYTETVLTQPEESVKIKNYSREWNGKTAQVQSISTPLGMIEQVSLNGWVQEYFLKTPADYSIMEYAVRNSRFIFSPENFSDSEKLAGTNGITWVSCGRSPMQRILVDYTGLENFAYHYADGFKEFWLLYETLFDHAIEFCRLIAQGPGRYIHMNENLTAEIWGPERYQKYHISFYEKALPLLHSGGKKVFAHYDGKLSSISELVAETRLNGIESFTVMPEGDMNYADGRKAFPDKFIWSNISIGVYELPNVMLRHWVRASVSQCAPDGKNFAFGILEDIPGNWKEKIPVILDELNNISFTR